MLVVVIWIVLRGGGLGPSHGRPDLRDVDCDAAGGVQCFGEGRGPEGLKDCAEGMT